MFEADIMQNVDDLVNAILLQAVLDWQDLVRHGECKRRKFGDVVLRSRDVSFAELEWFFRSEWCRVLCDDRGVYILDNLNEWTRDQRAHNKKARAAYERDCELENILRQDAAKR